MFSTRITSGTSLDTTLTETPNQTLRTLTQHLSLLQPYLTSKGLLKLSHESYNPTTSALLANLSLLYDSYWRTLKFLLGEIDFKFDIRRNSSFHSYQTRRSNDLHLPRVCTNWGKQTFIYQASKDWNNLDNDIKNSKSLSSFKAKLKTF